jgi:flagellar motor switch protein FliG
MRALGPNANAVWAALTPQEANNLTRAMDNLPVTHEQESAAAAQYLRDISRAHSPQKTPLWQQLSARDGQANATLLSHESPQVIAVILSRMTPESAATTVRALPQATATEALRRLLHLGDVQPAALKAIETVLNKTLSGAGKDTPATGHERVARIFDSLDSRAEQTLLASLDNEEPGVGDRIRALMFTFDDLATLDPASLQTLLAGTDRGVLIMALKGAKAETSAAFFNNLTARAGELLKSEIEASGPVRRSEIEAARTEIIALARTLIKRGDILSDDVNDDEFIE